MLNALNIGCGRMPMKDDGETHYVNVDMRPLNDTILKLNIEKFPLPWANQTFDIIYMFHTIEHIPEERHNTLLRELHRILKETGKLCLSYPEFPKVAKNYLTNKGGQRDFWKLAIYGRGLTGWDRHKALMDTQFFVETLGLCGFEIVSIKPERRDTFNTVIVCKPGEVRLTYEELVRRGLERAPSS